jgi:hypothetical protein
MKKQYIIAFLLLAGLGVVSTMAFSTVTSVDVTSDVYQVGDNGATGTVTKIKAVPIKGDLDQMKIILTMTGQTVNFDVYITLDGAVLTGITSGDDAVVTSGSEGTHDLATAYLEYTGCTALGAGPASWTLTVDATDATTTPTLWEDVTGLLVTISDDA